MFNFLYNQILRFELCGHRKVIYVLFIAFCTIAAGRCGMAQGQAAVSVSEQQAIRDVIERQVDAFRRDDAELAFSFAAPSIRHQFVTAENFMRMVRIAYLPVYKPKRMIFAAFRMVGSGDIIVRTLVVGPDDRTVQAIYRLQKQDNGDWRISACLLLPYDGQGA